MIDWPLVLATLCASTAVTIFWARRPAPNSGRWLGLTVALLLAAAVGLSLSGRPTAPVQAHNRLSQRPEDASLAAPDLVGLIVRVLQPRLTAAPPPASIPTAVLATDPADAPPTVAPTAAPSQPPPEARLLIPALNLDAPIIPIDLYRGEWNVEPLGQNVGWLTTTGSAPNAPLAMVLAGHMTITALQRGVFSQLWTLKLEAEVIYHTPAADYAYTVYDKRRLSPDTVRALYLPDGQVLQLVTCTTWNNQTFSYSERLLVRARLRETRPLTP